MVGRIGTASPPSGAVSSGSPWDGSSGTGGSAPETRAAAWASASVRQTGTSSPFSRGIWTPGTDGPSSPSSGSGASCTSRTTGSWSCSSSGRSLTRGVNATTPHPPRPPREGLFTYRTVRGAARSYGTDGILFEVGIFGRSCDTFRRVVGFLGSKQGDLRLQNVRYRGFYREKLTDRVVAV